MLDIFKRIALGRDGYATKHEIFDDIVDSCGFFIITGFCCFGVKVGHWLGLW